MLTSLIAPALNTASRADLIAELPATTGIPKIIHQVYPSHQLPEKLQQNVDSLRALNPGWQYRLYDDADMLAFTQEHFGAEVLRYLTRIEPSYGAARADLFRYLAVYRCGGVYLDIKSVASRPLDAVLAPDDAFLLAHWQNQPGEEHERFGIHAELASPPRGEYQQWHVVAAAGHPYLRAVIGRVLANIDRYNRVLHGTGKTAALLATGPVAYTLAIEPIRDRHPHRFVEAPTDLGFRYSLFQKMEHEAVFARHYSKSVEPLVRVGRTRTAAARLVVLARKVRRRLGSG